MRFAKYIVLLIVVVLVITAAVKGIVGYINTWSICDDLTSEEAELINSWGVVGEVKSGRLYRTKQVDAVNNLRGADRYLDSKYPNVEFRVSGITSGFMDKAVYTVYNYTSLSDGIEFTVRLGDDGIYEDDYWVHEIMPEYLNSLYAVFDKSDFNLYGAIVDFEDMYQGEIALYKTGNGIMSAGSEVPRRVSIYLHERSDLYDDMYSFLKNNNIYGSFRIFASDKPRVNETFEEAVLTITEAGVVPLTFNIYGE